MAKKDICWNCAEAVEESYLFIDRLIVTRKECDDCGKLRPTVQMDGGRYRALKIRAGLNPDIPASDQPKPEASDAP